MDGTIPIEICYAILFIPSTVVFVLALWRTKGPWHKAVVIFFWVHVIAGIINSFFYTSGSFDKVISLEKAPVVWKYSLFTLLGTNAFTLITFFFLIFLFFKKFPKKPEKEDKS